MTHSKANIREAAITVMLDYSIILLLKDDSEGKAKVEALQILGQLAEMYNGGGMDEQSHKRLRAAVANLTYQHAEGKTIAKSLNLLK